MINPILFRTYPDYTEAMADHSATGTMGKPNDVSHGPADVLAYYRDPRVVDQMVHFLGGSLLEEATTVYLSRCEGLPSPPYVLKKPHELGFYLERGLDVGRSLWDRKSLLFHLDIEYVNFDSPPLAYLNRERTFRVQQPLILATKAILRSHGIQPLHLLSGRGHHFVWQVRRDSETFRMVQEQGYLSPTLEGRYRSLPLAESLPIDLGRAFSAEGLIMEFLASRILQESAQECEVPVRTAEVVPWGNGDREIICVDLSEYGDPLHMRMTRVPFSVYRKQRGLMLDSSVEGQVPPILIMIPSEDSAAEDSISAMEDPGMAAEIAGRADTRIPDATEATGSIVKAYGGSPLRRFHEWFYAEEHEDHRAWPDTYDRTPLHLFPPCIRKILIYPNELLLKPTWIQLLVRAMMGLGWHPRHVAGLIRSKYERDYGWGPVWYEYDACTRADFYVRVFSGALVSGQDELDDLTCLSTGQKGLCSGYEPCGGKLSLFRDSLLNRKCHGLLGCRPFNRLIL